MMHILLVSVSQLSWVSTKCSTLQGTHISLLALRNGITMSMLVLTSHLDFSGCNPLAFCVVGSYRLPSSFRVLYNPFFIICHQNSLRNIQEENNNTVKSSSLWQVVPIFLLYL